VKFVLDASVALRWFVAEERSKNADAVYRRLVDEPETFAVPELFCYEVFSALFRVHPRAWETFEQGILPLLRSGMLRYPMTDNVATKAGRYVAAGLTGYDASYAALAEELDAVWLTFDSRAHMRIRKHGVSFDVTDGLPADW
jgi:predicted nucleic acid-binding protein